jgi:hypothetical protein
MSCVKGSGGVGILPKTGDLLRCVSSNTYRVGYRILQLLVVGLSRMPFNSFEFWDLSVLPSVKTDFSFDPEPAQLLHPILATVNFYRNLQRSSSSPIYRPHWSQPIGR